jgi:tetratricopeptide (TPR) repeat protein/TolB-like protein
MRSKYINFLIFLAAFIFLLGCEGNVDRKIKLSDAGSTSDNISQTASSVLQVSPEQQRYVAILNFKNDTNDPSLNWLRRGLADMFATELSQSPYLNIIPIKRIREIAQKRGVKEAQLSDPTALTAVAQEARAEIVLSGRIYPLGDSLCIDVDLTNTTTGRLIKREMVHGYGLEQIFSMVSDLSDRVRSSIRGELEEIQYTGVDLKEMTKSVEAFRYFSQGREKSEKFLHEDAIECYKDAIKADTTFAAAYLNLAYLTYDFEKDTKGSIALQKAKKYANKLSDTDKIKLQLLESISKGEYMDLIPILEEALDRSPSDVELRIQLARYSRGMGDFDRALQEFEAAAELDPGRKMIYNDLGYVHANRGDYTSAVKNIDTYIELAPDEPNPYDSKGEILLMAGRLNEAAEQFKIALNKWPKFYYSAMHLAHVYAETGDEANALRYINQSLASTPNEKINFNTNLMKARILWKFGKVKQAQKLLDDLIREFPYINAPVILAGEMYKSTGEMSKANTVYSSALNRFRKYFNEKKGDFNEVDNFVGLMLRADLPDKDVIPVLEKVSSEYELPQLHKFIIDRTLALMYFRIGESEKALDCSDKIISQEFDFLLSYFQNSGWGTWRYFFESLKYTSNVKAYEHPLARRILNLARDSERKDLEALASFVRANVDQVRGDLEAVANEYQDIGVPLETDWMVLGPFAANEFSGFEHQFPPEKEIKLDANYQGAKSEIKWRGADDAHYDGYMNLQTVFDYSYWTVGYALTYAFCPEERKVQIRVGTDETFKLWLNDGLISQRYYHDDAAVDRDIATVILHPGYNKLLLKVTNTDLDWGFYFRITDEGGNAFYDITYHSPDKLEKKFANR